MKLINYLLDGLKGYARGATLILIVILIVLGIVILVGCITYFLISLAFPEYVTFGWYWLRFIALGIIVIVIASD